MRKWNSRLFIEKFLLTTMLHDINKLRTIIVSPIVKRGVPFLNFSNTFIRRKSNPRTAKNISKKATKLQINPDTEIIRRNSEISLIDLINGPKARYSINGTIVDKLSFNITVVGSP